MERGGRGAGRSRSKSGSLDSTRRQHPCSPPISCFKAIKVFKNSYFSRQSPPNVYTTTRACRHISHSAIVDLLVANTTLLPRETDSDTLETQEFPQPLARSKHQAQSYSR